MYLKRGLDCNFPSGSSRAALPKMLAFAYQPLRTEPVLLGWQMPALSTFMSGGTQHDFQEGILVVAGMGGVVSFKISICSLLCHSPRHCAGHSFAGSVTPQEEEELRRLAAMPNIYETIAKSIAPSIYGSTDIKKAIACLLFGGSRKRWGRVSLVERQWWQGCHSWHKALVQPSGNATNHLLLAGSAWLSK